MVVKLFAVLDEKAGVFTPPFTALAPGVAIRLFEDSVRGDSPWSKHPGDYKLYQLGEYDDNSGFVAAVVPPVFLVSGSDVLVGSNGVPKMVRDA